MVAPRAPLLSSRGKVLEHGMPRLFRRLTEGVFDEDDVRARRTSWPFFELRARRMASRCRSRSAIRTGKHRGMA
jgi:phospholipase/carboxylesterase